MILKYQISIERFIKMYLRPSKRKTDRIKLYRTILAPFRIMMDEYIAWRDKTVIRANVTVSKASLEWYLNHLFDSVEERIYINSNRGSGVILGIREEDEEFEIMGIRAADEEFIITTLRGEHPDLGFNNFGVFIPAALSSQTDAIRGIVDEYALAGMDYIIIEY